LLFFTNETNLSEKNWRALENKTAIQKKKKNDRLLLKSTFIMCTKKQYIICIEKKNT
jgi:hypothetical protein